MDCVFVCVCVCVCVRVCVSECVHVCERETERQCVCVRERHTEECVCVCKLLFLLVPTFGYKVSTGESADDPVRL